MATHLSRSLLLATLLGGALQWPVHAFADENGSLSGALPEAAVKTEVGVFGSGAIEPGALDVYRGGAENLTLELNKNQSTGTVTDNQAYNLTTGNNLITDGSLAGASGFSTVIQNSGNNVLIQNSTIINLQVK
ncbi:MAG: hypothetical protein BGO63_19565 [Candidatus Accumulibacter sp. 66-26]|nr:hypothetical protein [Accumulibacter sp.]OJW52077.1 MAG: hypothetical protein BGO63_19565 [Candidatus Accumulibacter sp. 66-26]